MKKIRIGEFFVEREVWDAWMNSLYDENDPKSRWDLQNSSGMCCLGKAVNVAIPKKLQERDPLSGFLLGGLPTAQDHCPFWLRIIDLEFKVLTQGRSIATLNDNGIIIDGFCEEMSHPEIADLLIAVFEEGVLYDD